MEVNGTAVMRRRSDSWLNATQILKVAGVEKGKRTKVLEKEILSGEHEKVQGGYGKYQGTWINYTRGVSFARHYGVEDALQPLFEYDMGLDGNSIAGQGDLHTPTKEQAMAAQRKRNMLNGGAQSRIPVQSSNGTFFKSISKSAANAVNAINKARMESPAPRPGINGRPMKPDRRSSQQVAGSQDSAYPGSSQQSMQSLHSENNFGGNGPLDPALRSFDNTYGTASFDQNGDSQEPPRKRMRQDPIAYEGTGGYDTVMTGITDAAGPQGFVRNGEHILMGLQPLPQPSSHSALEKQQMLTSLFLDANQTDFSNHPALLHLSGEDLDIPIDATAHTALHWAATLARTSLLRALVMKGASIYRLNGGGETALIRAALTTNNLDQNSFRDLLELLGPTIEIRDGRGRTVLHHIAVSSAVKGRGSACRYYLETLLEFVVRQGSASNSQQTSFQDPITPAPKPIGLARFMSEIVNAEDISGDTALNLAARIGNKSIIQQLLEVGADPTIPNRGGLKPVDFGVGGEPEVPMEIEPLNKLSKTQRNTVSKVTDSSQELMTCKSQIQRSKSQFERAKDANMTCLLLAVSTLLANTESSFRAAMQTKQSLIDQNHARLREVTAQLTDERRQLAEHQRKVSERKALRQRIANLRRANESSRNMLANSLVDKGSGSVVRTDISVGEADAGLEVDLKRLPSIPTGSEGEPFSPSLDTSHKEYLASLPPTPILRARTAAYKRINGELEEQAKTLQSQSSELEGQLRKVVALCTGTDESRVEEMVSGLCAAAESEAGDEVEVGRVREFLRRVEGEVGA